jgi:hypothetical protein
MEQNILKIPYAAVNNDWNLLQQFLKIKGNPKYIIVGNIDFSYNGYVSDLGNLVGVVGDLLLSYSSIESFGELKEVEGNLALYGCQNIKTLGKLNRVDGDFSGNNAFIQSLGELEFVSGDLALSFCPNIKTLGKLKKVGGILNLSYSPIQTLGELKEVYMNLFLSSTWIQSLDELEFVGGDLWIDNTNITKSELDKVKVIGKIIGQCNL